MEDRLFYPYQTMAFDTKIDSALMDLIDIELAKPVKCTRDDDYGSYWMTEWSDSKGEVIRREAFNGMTGSEIALPRLNVIIAENHILGLTLSDIDDINTQKFMIVSQRLIEDMILTGKDKNDEKKTIIITQ